MITLYEDNKAIPTIWAAIKEKENAIFGAHTTEYKDMQNLVMDIATNIHGSWDVKGIHMATLVAMVLVELQKPQTTKTVPMGDNGEGLICKKGI